MVSISYYLLLFIVIIAHCYLVNLIYNWKQLKFLLRVAFSPYVDVWQSFTIFQTHRDLWKNWFNLI